MCAMCQGNRNNGSGRGCVRVLIGALGQRARVVVVFVVLIGARRQPGTGGFMCVVVIETHFNKDSADGGGEPVVSGSAAGG